MRGCWSSTRLKQPKWREGSLRHGGNGLDALTFGEVAIPAEKEVTSLEQNGAIPRKGNP